MPSHNVFTPEWGKAVTRTLSGGTMSEPEKIEHPSWCDPSACTAPETRPAVVDFKENGEHRSATVTLGSYTEGLALQLCVSQSIAPWSTAPYLRVELANGQMSWMTSLDEGGFQLFELLAQPTAEAARLYPLTFGEKFWPAVEAITGDD